MRIVHIIGGLNRGGIENFVYNHLKVLSNEHKFHIIAFSEEANAMFEDFAKIDCQIHYVKPLREQGLLSYYKVVNKKLKKIKPDVVHSHSMQKSGLDCMIAYFSGVKVRVAHSHNTKHEFDNKLKSKIVLWIFKILIKFFSNKKLACGEDAGIYLYGKRSKYEVFLNSIFIDDFLHDRDKSAFLSKRVLFVGRLSKQKNPIFALKIISRYIEKYDNDIILTIIGTGNMKDEVLEYINREGLNNNVDYVGTVNNVDDYLKKNNYLIMPSLYEGLPVALIEAQISGIECIVSDSITREADLKLSNIHFLSIQDIDVWIKKIHDLLPSSLTKEKVRNSKFVQMYDVRKSSKRLIKIYEE